MKKIKWHKDVKTDFDQYEEPVPVLEEVVIDGLESIFQMKFPSDYRTMLKAHHGDSPLHSDYRIHNGKGEVHGGIGLLLSPDPYICNETIFSASSDFPRGVMAFASDGGGNYLCFDARNAEVGAEPKVVYYDHEFSSYDDLVFICNSFSAFIETLEIPDDVLEDLAEQGFEIQ